MAQLEFKVRDVNNIGRKMSRFNMTVFEPGMGKSAVLLEGYMKKYPRQRAGSTYRRTGTLGRSWEHSVSVSTRKAEAVVSNAVKYGPFVQSQQFQAKIHRGLWQTDDDAANDNQRKILDFLVNDLDKHFR